MGGRLLNGIARNIISIKIIVIIQVDQYQLTLSRKPLTFVHTEHPSTFSNNLAKFFSGPSSLGCGASGSSGVSTEKNTNEMFSSV